ncbi:glycosyltransferase family 9 protein [Chitinophaga sp.]|uniref:glycosyltransferase family 9 protein n=1 Tax=Chitinophaga sp. TaxID=1869181 RepID=UPI0031D214D3
MKESNTPHRQWAGCKRILVVRPDNMGDLLMSTPAIRALKQTFECEITVLTSSRGALIAGSIPEIDDTIIFDAPWVKTESADNLNDIVILLKNKAFDGAVIFTVYSQNPLPSALLVYQAGIPLRLAYCRENPYGLLTQWEPDKEPYEYIRHQVRRDLDLVGSIGAHTADEQLKLEVDESLWSQVQSKIAATGLDLEKPWIILHPDVSEERRLYPVAEWAAAVEKLSATLNCQFLLTGLHPNEEMIQALENYPVYSLTGQLDILELITLVRHARLVIAVNTGIIHIAAATGTAVLVIYALTNPQHTPWNVHSKVLYFDIPEKLRSRNEVVRYAYHIFAQKMLPPATPESIAISAAALFEQADGHPSSVHVHNAALLSNQ